MDEFVDRRADLNFLRIWKSPVVDERSFLESRFSDIEFLKSWLKDGCGGSPISIAVGGCGKTVVKDLQEDLPCLC